MVKSCNRIRAVAVVQYYLEKVATEVHTVPWMETHKNRHACTVTELAYSNPRFKACRYLRKRC